MNCCSSEFRHVLFKGAPEVAAAQVLMDKFMGAPLNCLERCAAGEETLSREQMLANLSLVGHAMQGAGGLLPAWTDGVLVLKPTRVELRHQSHVAFQGQTPELTIGGANVRKRVVTVLHSLLAHILQKAPDDTKALTALTGVYQKVLFFAGVQRDEYDSRWKGFQAVKKCMENKLLGRKKHIRRIIIDRTHLQHESRMIENANKNFTEMHRQIYNDLLILSTSHYAEVRIKGQEVLGKALKFFSYSYEEVVPRLVALLGGGNDISHEQFKGALYLVLGPKGKSLLIKHNWETFAALCPAVVQASHSEKPSIIKVTRIHKLSQLMNYTHRTIFQVFSAVQETVVHHLETLTITLNLPDACLPHALAMWNVGEDEDGLATSLAPTGRAPSNEEVEEGLKKMKEENARREKLFMSIIDTLCSHLESGKLHWRQYNAGFAFLATLTRYKQVVTTKTSRDFSTAKLLYMQNDVTQYVH